MKIFLTIFLGTILLAVVGFFGINYAFANEPGLEIVIFTVNETNISPTTIKVHWKSASSVGVNDEGGFGEYRYSTSEVGLESAAWSTNGVSDFSAAKTSEVILDGFNDGIEYFFEVRKWYSENPRIYGNSKVISFIKGAIDIDHCVDSDGGDNIYTKGTITRTDKSGANPDACAVEDGAWYSYVDKCSGDLCYVDEGYCDAILDYNTDFPSYYVPCPNGCADGVCFQELTESLTIKKVWAEESSGDGYILFAEILDDNDGSPSTAGEGVLINFLVSVNNSFDFDEYEGVYNSSQRNYYGEGYWSSGDNITTCGYHTYQLTATKNEFEDLFVGSFDIACENSCSDYDGEDYYVDSYIDDNNGVRQFDTCVTGSQLREYTCNNESGSSILYDCPYGCESGKCHKLLSEQCTDTDGGQNYETKGSATGKISESANDTFTDHCVSGTQLNEAGCSYGYIGFTSAECVDGACVDGACVYGDQITCTDSDGGYNYDVFGKARTSEGLTTPDNCLDKLVLQEAYCTPLGTSSYLSVYCPIACLDGACVKFLPEEDEETIESSPEPEENQVRNESEETLLNRIAKLEYKISELERTVVELEKSLVTVVDQSLTNRLKGRILLQVEENGEAWYVDEDTEKKYYLKDGESAYVALNAFGLGISNANISKIPIGIEERAEIADTDNDGLDDKLEEALGTDINNPDTDGDGFSDGAEVKNGFNPLGAGVISTDQSLANDLSGKILLQVESRGEAWYINPEDGKRYYMKDGAQAYQIMRFLSLGITNDDLRKISVGAFE